jgi:hypothetical protein
MGFEKLLASQHSVIKLHHPAIEASDTIALP